MIYKFLVACYATLHPALSVRRSVRPSVGPSVRPSVGHTLLFLGFWGFWHHCSCSNDLVTSIMAPAHPHATGVAVYPALLFWICSNKHGLVAQKKVYRPLLLSLPPPLELLEVITQSESIFRLATCAHESKKK